MLAGRHLQSLQIPRLMAPINLSQRWVNRRLSPWHFASSLKLADWLWICRETAISLRNPKFDLRPKETAMTITEESSDAAAMTAQSREAATDGVRRPHRITLIPGEGPGPAVIGAATECVRATGIEVEWEQVAFDSSSMAASGGSALSHVLDAIRRNGVALMGPVQSPAGSPSDATRSAFRSRLGLFTNYRRVRTLPEAGSLPAKRNFDLAIFMENPEGAHAGISQLAALGVVGSMEFVAQTASLRIADAAFGFARREGRKLVSSVYRGDEVSELEFLRCCRKTARSFKDILYNEVFAGEMAVALPDRPEEFDVILSPGHVGTCLAGLCSFLAGGLGLLPMADLGEASAIFSAAQTHLPGGGDPTSVNPTGSIRAAGLLLEHLGENSAAQKIEAAVAQVYRAGRRLPPDVGGHASTTEFCAAVCDAVVRLRHLA